MLIQLLFFLAALFACSQNQMHDKRMAFEGRLKGFPTYQAKIPHNWKILMPASEDYLHDTTQPIFSCSVLCGEWGEIVITIHNFPTANIEERVSAQAQIKRWQNQFSSIDPASLNYNSIAYNGFTGYLFEAAGIIKEKPAGVLAIAMQIIPEHYRTLQNNPAKEKEHAQMRADYTIKATGSPIAIALKREEILLFAESFELIQAIPTQI